MAISKLVKHYPHHTLKYCPKCGNKGFAPEDRATFLANDNLSNVLKCSNMDCEFIMFINSVAAVGAIIHVSHDTLLLAKRKVEPMKGTLDLPGGFVNPRETAEDALKREVFEEFNLKLSKLIPYKTQWNEYDYKGMVYFSLDLAFICEVADWTDFRLNEPDEVEREDVPINDLNIDEVGFESIKKILKSYQDDFLKDKIEEL